jgi:dephospho-CoA kinase
MIIGITGTIGSGKGTIVEQLVSRYGYIHASARNLITDEVKKRGLPVNRDSMQQVANDLRKTRSPSYIAETLYSEAEASGKNAVIESLRTPGEIEAIKSKGPCIILAVDADPSIRYARIRTRGTETDQIDYATFLAQEAKELENQDPWKQNIKACMLHADHHIENNGSKKELEHQIDELLKTLASHA